MGWLQWTFVLVVAMLVIGWFPYVLCRRLSAGVIVAAILLAHAVCAPWPSKRRLRNRQSIPCLACPNCRRGRLVRHSYGTATLWSCHECNHLQFEAPRG